MNSRNLATQSQGQDLNFWKNFSGHQYIHKIDFETLKPFLKSHSSALVLFYAPWCRFCVSMAPEFSKAAAVLTNDAQSSSATLAAINSDGQQNGMKEYRVVGFPTIHYYKNGQFVQEYNLRRSKEDFVKFMINPPSSQLG